ncbi:ATP-dependent dethiobiotin synthetase BioD 1 [Clostridium acetireducens DSM 10703]|jgi:dethiobiotin synthetase|uniref:ATP-dependent dethiobiotin synthetase BioD n=1 Tax=Clostridium acetireducens DSM 10703 TaxID=1121290 RepID=A0A1E8F008_9CLOT|nr:dethiobiotin synthase [Clostridium acetireducens]OFI06747.1 ATP-dependent dethiobiotin synthetase BioD 1 [Clostridium acetireducens DSM 10703]
MTKGIYIVGTDTDVGKTVVSAGIMHVLRSKGYNATYFKAALSGALIDKNNNIVPEDTRLVSTLSNLKEDYQNTTAYIFKTAVSPHLASKIENIEINVEHIKEKFNSLKNKYDYIVAEGSGGICCPLIEKENKVYMLYHLIKELNIPVLLVSTTKVGSINHTLLTIEFIKKLGINIKGIIFNSFKNTFYEKDNINIIKKLTNIPIIATLPFIDTAPGVQKMEESLKQVSKKLFQAESLIEIMEKI